MQFDTDNEIVKLCGQGMMLEGEGMRSEAYDLFKQAWQKATTDFEKFTAAHYVARHQESIADKLKWDKAALNHALKVNDEDMKSVFPSLYLNIGKCYENMADLELAKENYRSAQSFATHLPNDGYGNMIRSGIKKGLERTL